MRRIVVISCGGQKLATAAAASELYRGSYFRMAYDAASVLERGRVFILSARYGLIRPWAVLEPYDLRLGDPDAITYELVRIQAALYGITAAPVVALCGAAYADVLDSAWGSVARPLQGLGIGQQRHVLAHIKAGELECDRCSAWHWQQHTGAAAAAL